MPVASVYSFPFRPFAPPRGRFTVPPVPFPYLRDITEFLRVHSVPSLCSTSIRRVCASVATDTSLAVAVYHLGRLTSFLSLLSFLSFLSFTLFFSSLDLTEPYPRDTLDISDDGKHSPRCGRARPYRLK